MGEITHSPEELRQAAAFVAPGQSIEELKQDADAAKEEVARLSGMAAESTEADTLSPARHLLTPAIEKSEAASNLYNQRESEVEDAHYEIYEAAKEQRPEEIKKARSEKFSALGRKGALGRQINRVAAQIAEVQEKGAFDASGRPINTNSEALIKSMQEQLAELEKQKTQHDAQIAEKNTQLASVETKFDTINELLTANLEALKSGKGPERYSTLLTEAEGIATDPEKQTQLAELKQAHLSEATSHNKGIHQRLGEWVKEKVEPRITQASKGLKSLFQGKLKKALAATGILGLLSAPAGPSTLDVKEQAPPIPVSQTEKAPSPTPASTPKAEAPSSAATNPAVHTTPAGNSYSVHEGSWSTMEHKTAAPASVAPAEPKPAGATAQQPAPVESPVSSSDHITDFSNITNNSVEVQNNNQKPGHIIEAGQSSIESSLNLPTGSIERDHNEQLAKVAAEKADALIQNKAEFYRLAIKSGFVDPTHHDQVHPEVAKLFGNHRLVQTDLRTRAYTEYDNNLLDPTNNPNPAEKAVREFLQSHLSNLGIWRAQ